MIVDVSQLPGEIGAQIELVFQYVPGEDDFDVEARLVEPVSVHVTLTRGREQVWLRGDLRAQLELTCDRCLKAYETTLTGSYMEEYRPRRSSDPNQEELDDEVPTVYYVGEKLDITDGVRQALLLMLPTKHLCSEDCKGLCPQCGQDLNESECDCETDDIDPRFAVLKELELDKVDEGSVS